MKVIIILIILTILQNQMILFDFNKNSNYTNWRIVDDVVMGGRSNGNFDLNDAGNGIFSGYVSLENNGGFSMVQYAFETKNISSFSRVSIYLKGDGKTYQFRVKSSIDDSYSYVIPFKTTGAWETIEIPLNTMYPSFRGRKLDKANYPGQQLEMVAFLIGNKKEERFKLEIDSIVLR
ncbi:CIA30 family protein [Seonamhaeicola aphaedonensis]|uniref:Complex I intermediate-associated protein 30 (CIA30) n=1 Tax=Seonamhaeicola aphaedonensis TaxID=1461338 RepID=A0A3D9HG28_9FLAO|nr:CIA30 family protein [Seonamhaeicola aphaedonensis]RED48439.1 complex I intermediate-associated protein 30 (CIA30) [Seonamhaeicola aphaedonensis]